MISIACVGVKKVVLDCILREKSDCEKMSYSALESGYQGLRQNRPGFYVGDDNQVSIPLSSFEVNKLCKNYMIKDLREILRNFCTHTIKICTHTCNRDCNLMRI